MDLTPADKIGNEEYERWRLTPNRDAYVAAIVREAARRAYQAGREDAARAERLAAIAATLHTVADWGAEGTPSELHRIAVRVEAGDVDDWDFCPVCEEVICDQDCPLAPIRSYQDDQPRTPLGSETQTAGAVVKSDYWTATLRQAPDGSNDWALTPGDPGSSSPSRNGEGENLMDKYFDPDLLGPAG